MGTWHNLKISHKISASIFLIALTLTALLALTSIASIRSMGTKSLQDKGSSLAIITAETVKPAAQYNVKEDAEKVLAQLLASDSDVSAAAVVIQGPKGDLAVSVQQNGKGAKTNLAQPLKKLAVKPPAKKGEVALLGEDEALNFLAANIDITANENIKNGYLLLALNNGRLSRTLNASTATMAGLGVLMLALGTFCALMLARAVTSPLRTAVTVANALADGDLRVEVNIDRQDEIGQLMSAMQNMVLNLRNMISKTVGISNSIAGASKQLQDTSALIASGAERVASQTDAVATASEQMSATSSEIACNCGMAAEASRNSTNAAHSGARVVKETIEGMSIISERVEMTSKTIEALGARSEQIGQIVGTIEDIADQTNLLALNAAIEAARAGEQGRGFAVVADEVRALAERTTKATREIGEMIKAIQNETSAAVKAMDEGVREVGKGASSARQSGEALEDILHRINEVSTQIQQIATAAEEQTATTTEVTTKVHQITDEVASTASGAVATADSAAHLAQQANDLQELVTGFRLP